MGTETHHTNPAHDTDLLHRLLPELPLLHPRRLLPGPARLLRSVCHSQLLHLTVPLCRAQLARAEELLSRDHAEELVLGRLLPAEVYWRRE